MTTLFINKSGSALVADTPEEAAQIFGDIDGGSTDPASLTKSIEPDSDELEAKYGTPENHGKTANGDPTMLETYGEDYQRVLQIHKDRPRHLWTIVDGDDGVARIVPGLRFVDRIAYLTTPQPWDEEAEINEAYVW
jgi:hypothetical protein